VFSTCEVFDVLALHHLRSDFRGISNQLILANLRMESIRHVDERIIGVERVCTL
jgi:hypothetical protein